MAINNALKNYGSDKRRRRFWPAQMPIRNGMTFRREVSPTSALSRAFVPIAEDSATVDAVNNMPMICASLNRPFFTKNFLRDLAEKILFLNTSTFRENHHRAMANYQHALRVLPSLWAYLSTLSSR